MSASKKLDKERASSLNIDSTKLSQGGIIGTADLYDVKEYNSKTEFVKDKNKHFADIDLPWRVCDLYLYFNVTLHALKKTTLTLVLVCPTNKMQVQEMQAAAQVVATAQIAVLVVIVVAQVKDVV